MPSDTAHDAAPASTLERVLAGAEADLATTLARRLDSATSPTRPRDTGPEQLQARCALLATAFVEAATGAAPWAFAAFVRRSADERVDEGHELSELQLALSVLEARAWQLVVERGSSPSLVRNLAVVTGLVGQAKDELARAYLAHKLRADARVAELQQRLDELSRGGERPASPERIGAR